MREGWMKIGYALMLGEHEETEAPTPYAELRAMALQAEEAGLDSVWVYDHLLYRFPDQPTRGIWEGWSVLCGLAEATSRVELGTIVMCTAWRNPALQAKMAITADEVSNGRIILGLGAGWHQPEFEAFGYQFDHLAGRFDESMQIISPHLKEGKVDFSGKYYSAPNCEMRPRGPRPGGPPILIASKGERMLRLTAQYADQWNTAWLGRPALLAERRAALEAACEKVGRDPSTLEVTVGITTLFPDLAPDAMPDEIDPDRALTGTAEEMAAVFKEYEALGVAHLILVSTPDTPEAVARIGEAVAAYKAMG
jgi:alkanesulfonate monooxygenase SsuD/methylene tetrahydromethanopterin reductase-like flavin-dependent oxidoreductase (luciferase family)